MQHSKQPGTFRRRARLATLCFACASVLLLNVPESAYCAAIMVQQNINLNGNNVTVDSYNSSVPGLNTNGQWAPSVSGDGGDVICLGGITNSVSIGNAIVYGDLYVATGVGASVGATGAIGTHAWVAVGNTGIEPGHLVPNVNFPFTNISLPDYSGFPTPALGSVVTTNSGVLVTNSYDAVIGGGNYVATSGLGNTIVTYPSTLVLPNGYSIANLTIVPGASLIVYVGGTSMSISGNQILNQAALPADFIVYCSSNVTSLAFSGSGQFSGVLIAPNADGSIEGGGATTTDISGAIMAKSLTFNGHVNVHFDEALVQQGIVPPSPPLLMFPAMSTSGQFQFNVIGAPGFNCIVESSTNLTDWQPVFTNASPFIFTDTNANPAGQSFYRAVYSQ